MAAYLITGGGGFIGRALTGELLEDGARVRVPDSLVDRVHGGSGPGLSLDWADR